MTAAQKWKALETILRNSRRVDARLFVASGAGSPAETRPAVFNFVLREMSRLSRPTRTGRKRP